MNDDVREIHCDEMAEIAQEFPEEISVVHEMLAEIGEGCPEGLAA